MENFQNQKEMRLITNENKYLKFVMPSFKDGGKFSENLLGVKIVNTKLNERQAWQKNHDRICRTES